MRILLVTSYFPPEFGAASDLYRDLAETFAENGHEVSVVTRFPRYRVERAQVGLLRRDRVGSATVVRVATSPFVESGPVLRGLDHLTQAPMYFLGGLFSQRPDVIVFHSPPLTLGLACWGLSRVWNVPYVANIQDLFPRYAVDIGLLTSRQMIRAFEVLERFVYRTAAGVTVNARGNEEYVIARGARPAGVRTISNYVDVHVVRPGPRDNHVRERLGFGARFVVLYSGTMGFQQDLDTVIDAADVLRDESGIEFVLVGDGVERAGLEARVRARNLKNVRFLPYQPHEDFPLLLQAADVGVVTLRKDVTSATVPSKLLGIMASGTPVLVSADPAGDAPRIVREAGAGEIVPPGDPEAFAAAVKRLRDNPEDAACMGRRGRRYAERHLTRQAAAKQYEELFEQIRRG
jgi:colanic acid biosynthesis glycosyl transferase WcaI